MFFNISFISLYVLFVITSNYNKNKLFFLISILLLHMYAMCLLNFLYLNVICAHQSFFILF